MTETYTCHSPAELSPVAARLLQKHYDKRLFAFFGEMGAGKTTFITEICRQLGAADTVASPTFAIVNEYATRKNGNIYHFDLYRLRSWEEMLGIGYEDYFYSGNYCFMEWPEKIINLLPDETIEVKISVSEDGKTRSITF